MKIEDCGFSDEHNVSMLSHVEACDCEERRYQAWPHPSPFDELRVDQDAG